MESKLKQQCQDSVGEIPTYENLLLRDDGFPHLVDRTQWQPAGTTPDHPCLCEIKIKSNDDITYQFWSGEFFGLNMTFKSDAIAVKGVKDPYFQYVKWREVRP
jgi:hypothetical protein